MGRYAASMRAIFRLDDIVVADTFVDLDVPQRCRFGIDESGSTWLVEDLRASRLDNDAERQRFVADAVGRVDAGTRVVSVDGAPVALTPLAPGIALDDLLDAIEAGGGTAPPAATLALVGAFVGAFAAAAARNRHAPWMPLPVLWLGVDGRLVSLGSIRRDDYATRPHPRSQFRYYRPEIMRGPRSVDEAGVVYVVGVVLHLLVHGCPPWADSRTQNQSAFEFVRAMRAQQRSVVVAEPGDPLAALARACTAFVAADRPALDDVVATVQQLRDRISIEGAWLPLVAGLCPDAWRAAAADDEELGVMSAGGAELPTLTSAPVDPAPCLAWRHAPPPEGVIQSIRAAGPPPRALPG